MRDLQILLGELSPAPGEPGLDDVRVQEICDLADAGNMAAAADRVESYHREGYFDLRTTPFLLYQVFAEDGPAGARPVLEAVAAIVDRHLPAFGPTKRREAHLDKRLAWLFETVVSLADYEEQKQTDRYASWLELSDVLELGEAIAAAEQLGEVLSERGLKGAAEQVARFVQWLRATFRKAKARDDAAPPPLLEGDEGSAEVGPSSRALGSPASEAPPRSVRGRAVTALTVGRQLGPDLHLVEIAASHRFLELMRKIEAFSRLVEKRQYDKAALVARDVQALIEAFDPREHFPRLFSEFSRLSAQNIGDLAVYLDEVDTPRFRALEQFYRVDLDAFVGD